jgi:hypothetical protein
MAHRSTIRDEIHTKHIGLAVGDCDQSGKGSQQGGFTGAVGSAQKHDPTGVHVEINPGEGRESTEQSDRTPEPDHG